MPSETSRSRLAAGGAESPDGCSDPTLATKAKGRRCVFCGGAAGSLEHAWPKWLQRWMNPNNERRIVQTPTGDVIDHRGWDISTHRHVCETCNHWMGNAFEGPASAPIRTLNTEHATLSLAAADQVLLVNWVYKTSLMLECTKVGGPGVERGECVRFRNRGCPPSDCSIIVGFCNHDTLAYHRSLSTSHGGERIGYATTMVVGRLFFHILGDTRALNPHDRLFARHLSARQIARLHPRTGRSIEWPLDGYFKKEAVEALANFADAPFEFIT